MKKTDDAEVKKDTPSDTKETHAHGFVAKQNWFQKIRDFNFHSFFATTSNGRMIALIAVILLVLGLGTTVAFLGQRTQTQQHASGTQCSDLKGTCLRNNLCQANCAICDTTKGCSGTVCCGDCTARFEDHAFCCNNFGNYHHCQYFQYMDCSTQLKDLGYFAGCAPPTPTPVPNYTCGKSSNKAFCAHSTLCTQDNDLTPAKSGDAGYGSCASGQVCCKDYVAPTPLPKIVCGSSSNPAWPSGYKGPGVCAGSGSSMYPTCNNGAFYQGASDCPTATVCCQPSAAPMNTNYCEAPNHPYNGPGSNTPNKKTSDATCAKYECGTGQVSIGGACATGDSTCCISASEYGGSGYQINYKCIPQTGAIQGDDGSVTYCNDSYSCNTKNYTTKSGYPTNSGPLAAKSKLCSPTPKCTDIGGTCTGPGAPIQTDTQYGSTYSYVGCTNGGMDGLCSVYGTTCCQNASVITAEDVGVPCLGPDKKTTGECWYDVGTDSNGSAVYQTSPITLPRGKVVLYSTKKGGTGICGSTPSLPYLMPTGSTVACLGDANAWQENPKCSDGTSVGTCYINNSCGSGKEINSIATQSYRPCSQWTTSGTPPQPYRICCVAGNAPSSTPTPTPKPSCGNNCPPPATPTPACIAGQDTSFSVTGNIPGIGNRQFANSHPKNIRRYVTVAMVDSKNNPIHITPANINDILNGYNIDSNGNITISKVDMGKTLACDNYTLLVQIPGSILTPAKPTIAYGKDENTNRLTLNFIMGDIVNVNDGNVISTGGKVVGDNKIDLNDLNVIHQCRNADPNADQTINYRGTNVHFTCGQSMNLLDYPDGGTQDTINADGIDEWAANYNTFLRGLINQPN